MDLKLIREKGESFSERIISIRREIHKHPETGFKEVETARLVAKELKSMSLEVKTGVGGTGVVGILRGAGDAERTGKEKTILIRADMDCLEIEERTVSPCCSEIPGLMHACGHDAHTAWVLGAAMILSGIVEEISGNVIFLFQPAEETTGGAAGMIAEGVLDDPPVTAAIAAHVDPSPWNGSGMIALKYGPMCAAPDNFVLTIYGPGGHNSAPHRVPDPMSVAVQIYTAFKALVERGTDPLEPVVLHIGTFRSGTNHNTIPDRAELTGTVRTLNEKMRRTMEMRMREIVGGICSAWNVTSDFHYQRVYPPMVNDNRMTDIVRKAAAEIIGEKNIVILEKPEMTGEDFSFFQERVPGTYINIGTYNQKIGAIYPLHSSRFILDESVLPTAAAILAASVFVYLNESD